MESRRIQLRQPAADELHAWSRPAAAAFGEPFTGDEFEHDKRLLEIDRLIGGVDGDTWVSTGGAYSFRLTVPGGEVKAAGITIIAVAPSHRRQRILRQMMDWLIAQAIERDESVAILWASESAIYQRFGFGIAALQTSFNIERQRIAFLRPVDTTGEIRLLDRETAMAVIPAIYEARRPHIPGALSRTAVKWRSELLDDAEWMQRGNGPKFMAAFEVDGEARAYAVYRVKSEWDEQGPNNTVHVTEVLGLDPAAERAVWEWLTGMDLAGRIKGERGPVPHPLMLALTEPRRLGLTVRDGLWLRLIDMPAALAARGYDAAGSITFELSDALLPSNAGRWRLVVPEAADASATRSPVGARHGATVTRFDGEPDVVLDTSDLASVYLGALRFSDLVRSARVIECRPGAVAAADRLFATSTPPWSSTPF